MMKTDRPQRNVEIESLADETRWLHAIFQGWANRFRSPSSPPNTMISAVPEYFCCS
jgi:hypothetical protein